MSPFEITALMFTSMVCLMLIGVPITFCLGSVGVLSTYFLWGAFALDGIYFAMVDLMSNIVLTALPLYLFMGFLLHYSGIAGEMFDTIYKWAGGLRGALGMGTVAVCALMAAMVGISGATVLSLGTIVVPAMLARGYHKRMTVGLVMSGGALGFLIPPSMMMIMYGFLSDVSVGKLFAGGVVPGLILAAAYIVYIGIRCLLNPAMGPALPLEQRASFPEKIRSLKYIALPLLVAGGIMISIFTGFASPTEAAALGCALVLIGAAVQGKLKKDVLTQATVRTFELAGFAGYIIIGALIFSKTYTGLGATALIKNVVIGSEINPWYVLIAMQLSFFALGMFLDDIGILFMCMPIYVPIIKGLGFDPAWFGILYVLNMQMAYLTPPYGLNLFYMKAVAPPSITIKDIYISIFPFLIIQLCMLILCMVFPEIITWLPNYLFSAG